ncbi:Uncharacterised protein [Enterococcus faecium]|uniref:hypothetical protein n=1 Tax=Enterococcus faecium TaxID=1352 RepID=UPI000A187797|nr:hypothetical protein [Enterococcus faecium]MCE3178544.1 hypothetical protein [Enterococcus faecium]NTL00628.1 hypothetical protein [Enterococcus faecium]NTN35477.1 hypothetical protein [Enterococcus faecium]NTN66658.1 hypothetical protein [Enterococcus faecium]NTO67108.1 hypothetical protein [Enterococcus faecium]
MTEVVYVIMLFCSCLFFWGLFHFFGCCIDWLVDQICTLLENQQKRLDSNKK